ncbi:hypothetical protein E4T80_04290 [Muribacter muris]|uniref:Integral membrane protein n=1 Tax=Muribacter muris TaxID=67855 RepID=A0A4Y9K350_9PAST|nr:DUF2301 domain-containing membrane protein [Muribacter muris]MBF0784698.1 hypothetical protein [Muribacter muris]MBF0827855.1 hypothetical protein [Muribacter muris]TFV11125.1 hypothetical protein E4T80_04290 [Muribacter muris]
MADPHIQSPMDRWDILTVILYRSGLTVALAMLFWLKYNPETAQLGFLVSGVMLASSLHLYLKSFRLLFQFVMWGGLLCHIFGFPELALGAAFLVIGGLCYKEYFCFRITGLNFQPLIFALLWVSLITQADLFIDLFRITAFILLAILTFKKWRMPLHFDIGDKGKYQI